MQSRLIIFLSVTIYLSLSSNTNLMSKTFSRSETCHLQERIDSDCAEIQDGVRYLLDCMALCRHNCSGVFWPESAKCSLARPCLLSFPSCSDNDTKIFFYEEKTPCQHDGVYKKDDDTCQCVGGWVGRRCERLPKNCSELRDYGYPTTWPDCSMRVNLDLDNHPTPINVRCDVFDTFDITVIMSSTGQFSNNKTWSQYLNGFFHDGDNFWQGLEDIKALNEAGMSTLMIQTNFYDENRYGSVFQMLYRNFKLGDASTGFDFTFSSNTPYAGSGPYVHLLTFGDCLGPVAGGQFSTFDMDNDQVMTENCAAEAGVGWWFKGDCDMICNPFGWSYLTKPGPESKSHIKMDGIDFASGTYAREPHIFIYFENLIV